MILKRVIFFSLLVLPLFGQVGIPFGKIKADFSTPIILSSTKETASSETPSYGDRFFNQVTFPYNLEATLGYVFSINRNNSILGFWRLKYGDDPLNSIFSNDETRQGITPTFTRQSINNLISFKSVNKFSFVDLSITAFAFFDLNREFENEDFSEGTGNNYSYNLSVKTDFFLPRQIVLSPSVSYAYNQFPNDFFSPPQSTINPNSPIPTSREDYHKVSVGLKNDYRPLNNLNFSFNYSFTYDFYLENPVQNFSSDGGYSTDNKRNLRNSLSFDLFTRFLPRADYHLFNLRLSYSFRNNDSNAVEVINTGGGTVVDLITSLNGTMLDDKTIVLQPTPGFYTIIAKDYEDFIYNFVGLYPSIKFHKQYTFNLGYSFSIKNYINNLALYGNGEKEGASLGSYKNENRVDMGHNAFLSFLLQNASKNITFTPYFGFQFSSSNSFTQNLNRDVYYLGVVTTYEF